LLQAGQFHRPPTSYLVAVIKDRDSGQSKGFGFVEMSDDSEGQKAIEALNGKELSGRALIVNQARPQVDRSSGGGFQR
jgi:RNA recognition motif-containing protein